MNKGDRVAGEFIADEKAIWQLVVHTPSTSLGKLAPHDLRRSCANSVAWQVHTTNLLAVYLVGPLRTGTTINFEPMASVDGQGFFLEDMYLITKDGAELLTAGVPIPLDTSNPPCNRADCQHRIGPLAATAKELGYQLTPVSA